MSNEVETLKSKSINALRTLYLERKRPRDLHRGSFVLLVVGSMYSLQLSYMRKAGEIYFEEGIIGKTHPEVGKGVLGRSHKKMKGLLIGNFEKKPKKYQDPVL